MSVNLEEIRCLLNSAEYRFRFRYDDPSMLASASKSLLLAAKYLIGYILWKQGIDYSFVETPLSLMLKVPRTLRKNMHLFDSIVPTITNWEELLSINCQPDCQTYNVFSVCGNVFSITDSDFRYVFCIVDDIYSVIRHEMSA